ncbi:hypothetical protein EPUS_08012 [Endocarpon pusillum Z07020]|uniref:Uncharacterized protein n=1 Tax=Endocarpon pusillum (strain Z07020 / HMAS-L-300199) TaxID=1263415 RepID=U1GDL7_ENDPU|nr:uncharacterized protein EPUS_08012 [Endocarpon pusillum Z07020]ERF69811.1 hypothetical protein EPUS_08012 [Endocarpon pusillum Z07020]
MTRSIILTGAPAPSDLQWDESALSSIPNVEAGEVMGKPVTPESSPKFSAQWRVVLPRKLPGYHHPQILHDDVLPAGSSKAIFLTTAELTDRPPSQNESVLTNTNPSTASMHTAAETLDDFYDQSLALQGDLTTSQLSEFQSQNTSLMSPQWSEERTQVAQSTSASILHTSPSFMIAPQHLNAVKDIPSAAYLRSIEPQTMTVNLIVGVMALPSPRSVMVGRRWGQEREMQLLEMLVGDETRAGFEITMWLSNKANTTEGLLRPSALEIQLQGLRPRDVVLLQNIALCAYQGRVHGQSLRRDVTKVNLLYRRKLDDTDPGGKFSSRALAESDASDAVMEKAKRVKRWLTDFVSDEVPENSPDTAFVGRARLPPDTQ